MDYGYTQNLYNIKPAPKIQLGKVLESLENFLKEVFKWGAGQSPATFTPQA